jgi:hypothetical protein
LISTSGGFPGEKKRSLILDETLSIEANSSEIECGAAAGAAAVAVAVVATLTGGATFGGWLVGEDIRIMTLAIL